jgi:8-oxo-dGTP diphosphatase
MVVYAAGAVLWRIENNKLKVALVHRGRYDDWAWAKGKVDPGETLPETAVREIREETGLKVKLGVPLGIQRYRLPNKNLKEVHYWAAKVTDKSLENSNFQPNEEISQVAWFTPNEAKKRLSYSHDHEQLDVLLALHKKGMLDTFPVILLRHGKARSRATWTGKESSRPLLTEGNSQAEALPPILKAFGAKLVFSSPWTRCLSTVAPYAQKRSVKVKTIAAFTETANEDRPEKTKAEISEIVNQQKSSVICTHRPVLPTMIEELEKRANTKLGPKLHLAALLKPGSMSIVHMSKASANKPSEVVDVEFASPLISKKK